MLLRSLIAILPLATIALASDNLALFAPYGTSHGDTFGTLNDDDSFGPISFVFPFYGLTRLDLYVNNNGLITFDGPVGIYTPAGLCTLSFPAIAPYWADVDTRASGGGSVFYRSTTDPGLLATWSAQVPDPAFHGVRMFIATWNKVGYYYEHTDKTDTFQAILITDGVNSWVFFNYGLLQWTTGDASGGSNGLGGTPASVGFAAGDGIRCAQTPTSLTANILNIKDFVTNVSGGIIAVCGNGVVEPTEQCDGGSCCTSQCRFINTTPCFCARQNLAEGAMGYYCNANGGFYQCLGGAFASQSRNMNCAPGTSCGCNFGVECSCHLTRSPCVSPSSNTTCAPFP